MQEKLEERYTPAEIDLDQLMRYTAKGKTCDASLSSLSIVAEEKAKIALRNVCNACRLCID